MIFLLLPLTSVTVSLSRAIHIAANGIISDERIFTGFGSPSLAWLPGGKQRHSLDPKKGAQPSWFA